MNEKFKKIAKEIDIKALLCAVLTLLLFVWLVGISNLCAVKNNPHHVEEIIKNYESCNNYRFTDWRKLQISEQIKAGGDEKAVLETNREEQEQTWKSKNI